MPSRTLVAVLVYGGRDYVPACLDSAARLPGLGDTVDVLVLDDCSPDLAWSAEVQDRCRALGFGYYRSPENIGIPRNMNLALLRAESGGYDFVVLANSDVLFPRNLVSGLVATAQRDVSIASVTAWSNSVSAFSLPNADAAGNLASVAAVDQVSDSLAAHFGDRAVDIPVGVGFCMLMPVPMARRVGLMDPVFGRGYCEEVDWCLRADGMGLRHVLAPSVFVYHIGSATSKEIGLLGVAQTSEPTHDALIDFRYPHYRGMLDAYEERGVIHQLRAEGGRALVAAAARARGYQVEATTMGGDETGGLATFVVDPARRGAPVEAHHAGFSANFEVDEDILGALEGTIGRTPARVVVRDRGPVSDRLVAQAHAAGVPVDDRFVYPQTV